MTKLTSENKPKRLLTKDGRLVGVLKGNHFKKSVRKSIHLFRTIGDNGSWGIDYDVLFNQLPETTGITIEDTETFTKYLIPAKIWRANGVIKHFKQGTTDHYTQVFLPVEFFSRAYHSTYARS